MYLKIKASNKELLQEVTAQIMNVATVVAGKGAIPEPSDILNPRKRGRYWIRENDGGLDKINLLPGAHNHSAFVKAEGTNYKRLYHYIVVLFQYRYDTPTSDWAKALTNMILVTHKDYVTLITQEELAALKG